MIGPIVAKIRCRQSLPDSGTGDSAAKGVKLISNTPSHSQNQITREGLNKLEKKYQLYIIVKP